LQVARTIQQSLLPNRPPHLKQFDIAGWNKPATETGGDYFDWMTLDNGRVVITLGDVTGHGIGPALLAAVCRAYSRAALMTERDLSRAFVTINESLNRDLTPERFVTFAAAACIPETGEIELLSAGHGPLVIYSRSQDRFSELKPQGTPLGILPCFNSEAPASLRMEAGDLVLLATDGFIEWQDERGEEFGLHRLEEAMRGSRDLSASDIIARLYDCVISFSHGTGQADDLTAVVIKRL
jgi:serine phosphatase RsbU (regulator of sigma subunit)